MHYAQAFATYSFGLIIETSYISEQFRITANACYKINMFRIAASAEARWRCSGAKLRTLFHFIKQKRDFFSWNLRKARSEQNHSTLKNPTEHA